MSTPKVSLYDIEVVHLLADAGIARSCIDLVDSQYVMVDRHWLFEVGIPAYEQQALPGNKESWDCDEIAHDFRNFMARCNALRKAPFGCAVLKVRYRPEKFPWGETNEAWNEHVNNIVITTGRQVVFIEPQLRDERKVYVPSKNDLGSITHCTDG